MILPDFNQDTKNNSANALVTYATCIDSHKGPDNNSKTIYIKNKEYYENNGLRYFENNYSQNSLLHHLDYEITMLYNTLVLIIENKKHKNFKIDLKLNIINNSLVESSLIHLRNLYDFLYSNPHNDDISAFKEIDSWASKKKYERMQEDINYIHKFIAHLTRERLNNKDEWEIERNEHYIKMLNSVCIDLEKFFNNYVETSDKEDISLEYKSKQKITVNFIKEIIKTLK